MPTRQCHLYEQTDRSPYKRNSHTQSRLLLDGLAASLEIPQSKYEAAERSYKSVGKWLDRDDSVFASKSVTVDPQGSFRLGTVIPPHHADGHYDLDVVCEIEMDKLELTQKQLKEKLGGEVKAYAKAHGMAE
jgi:hypothetical protein